MMRRWTWWSRAALLTAAASVLAAASVAIRAAMPDPRLAVVPALAETAPARPRSTPVRGQRAEELERIVSRAVDRNPFRPDRSRGYVRYGDNETPFGLTEERPLEFYAPEPEVRLLGLASGGPGASVAAVEIAGLGARILRVGEELAGYRLLSVSATEVRLRGRDSVLVLRVSSPDPLP
jgi:hypothetical protein